MIKNKFRIRFSLISSGKDSIEKQIFMIATVEGKEIFYYSGYRVNPNNFIKEKTENGFIQQVKKNTYNKARDTYTRINSRLKSMEIAAQSVYDKYFQDSEITEDSKKEFKKFLQIELGEYKGDIDIEKMTIIEAYEKYYNESNVSYNRKKQYKSDINRIKRYLEHKKGNIDFNNFDVLDFKIFLLDEYKLSENSLVTINKRIKAFFNHCKNRFKIIEKTPFDDIEFSKDIGTEVYQEPICMTREELTQLYNYKPDSKHKELIKDMFCLQSALGCRVSDFIRLNYSNIQDDKLTYFPKKVDGNLIKVIVPLSNRAKDIINKYKGHNRGDLIMPFINDVEYNSTLKNVFKESKLDRVIVVYNRDKQKEEFKKLYELATTHLARRTFVDILCQAGEPIHVVASMSGHSENSKAFDRYRRRPENLQMKAVSRSMD